MSRQNRAAAFASRPHFPRSHRCVFSGRTHVARSKLAQRHLLGEVVGAFLQDEVGARPRRQNVLVQVLQVDVVPKSFGDRARRILADGRIAVEVGFRILEGRFLRRMKRLTYQLWIRLSSASM